MHICVPCKDGYRIEFVKGGAGGGGGGHRGIDLPIVSM